MDELSFGIRQLLSECGDSISGLAHRTGIDRATLSKIFSGQRTPTAEQMELLLHALKASPAQRRGMLQLFDASRIPPAQLARRRQVKQLLESIFTVQDTLHSAPIPLTLQFTDTAPRPIHLINSIPDAQMALMTLLVHYLQSADQPLMLSPGLDKVWIQILVDAFAHQPHVRHTVWHLSQFVKRPEQETELAWNLHNLRAALPFVYLENADYTARFFYSNSLETLPGTLMPAYLLFPDCIFAVNADGKSAVILRDKAYVAHCRAQFERHFYESTAFVSLGIEEHTILDQMDYKSHFSRLLCESYWLRHEPPLVLCVDDSLIAQFALPNQPGRETVLPTLCRHLHEVQALQPHCFFTEAGLRAFIATGRIAEISDHLYEPIHPACRRLLLTRLIALCRSSNQAIRIIDPMLFSPSPAAYVEAYRTSSILFAQKLRRGAAEESYRSCQFSEDSITEAFCDFFSYLLDSPLLYSQADTIALLERYRDQLPEA